MVAAMGTANDSQLGAKVSDLARIMERLLAPDGCPWDREQTLDTLAPYLVEETYEVLEAIDSGAPKDHCEELGDLLLQIVFQAALRSREGHFDLDDVASGIVDKMIRRHPHVFGDAATSKTPDEVRQSWQRIKDEEKGKRATLDGIPRAMPALSRAQKLSSRAAAVGFDWPDVAGCRAKVDEELRELDEARTDEGDERVREEVGDLLFATVSLARKLGVEAESALRQANKKFEGRFAYVESELRSRGREPSTSTLEEMDRLWNEAKNDRSVE